MSKFICIMGESGSGKTTSLRNLPFEETIIIDADGKGLAWKGWRKNFNADNKNYARVSKPKIVLDLMQRISDTMPNVKYIVIDTLNSVMVNEEMDRMKEKNFDKWVDLAQCVWGICRKANELREDLTVIVTAHVQTEIEEGYRFDRIKTNGKKLNKLCLESLMPVVLYSKCKDGKHIFETRANNSTAKTPMGAIKETEIENDIMLVVKALEDY